MGVVLETMDGGGKPSGKTKGKLASDFIQAITPHAGSDVSPATIPNLYFG